MTRPRSTLVSLDSTSYYHCVARCVRRAFLCGEDGYSGKSFEHRRQWVLERLGQLARLFAIDICAYAIMSNHYHVVVRLDAERARTWSDREVMERWSRLFSLPLLAAQAYAGAPQGEAEQARVAEWVETWRARLVDLSWFMRCLNEHIARQANAEDGCTGRFWEGRFKSQALLDEAAVLSCMSYVDLNPVRAGLAATLEESAFTSIQQRIQEWAREGGTAVPAEAAAPVVPLVALGERAGGAPVAFDRTEYLRLVDWAGRIMRPGKRGAVNEELPPILRRLGLEAYVLLDYLGQGRRGFEVVVGSAPALKANARRAGQRFHRGLALARRLYPQMTA